MRALEGVSDDVRGKGGEGINVQLENVQVGKAGGGGQLVLALHDLVDLHLRARELGGAGGGRGEGGQSADNGPECLADGRHLDCVFLLLLLFLKFLSLSPARPD